MALKHFCIRQVSLFSDITGVLTIIYVSSSSWSWLIWNRCSTCWCMRAHILLLVSVWVRRIGWSVSWPLRRLSWLRWWVICDFLESISDSWLALIHWNCWLIFFEWWWLLKRLDKFFFIVNLMISTESWGRFYEWWSWIFTYAWRLIDKVIL